MKKIPDLSRSVMDKVVGFEEGRSRRWYIKYTLILVGLLSILVGSMYLVYQTLYRQETFELLTLFREDWEIIAEYWQDTLLVFWEEAPQERILGGIALVIVIAVIVAISRKKKRVVAKRLTQVAKYKRKRHIGKGGHV